MTLILSHVIVLNSVPSRMVYNFSMTIFTECVSVTSHRPKYYPTYSSCALTSVLIWIKTVWHSDYDSEPKNFVENKHQTTTKA